LIAPAGAVVTAIAAASTKNRNPCQLLIVSIRQPLLSRTSLIIPLYQSWPDSASKSTSVLISLREMIFRSRASTLRCLDKRLLKPKMTVQTQ
jgi:hypothetical protein